MGCIPVIAEADVTDAGGRYYLRTGRPCCRPFRHVQRRGILLARHGPHALTDALLLAAILGGHTE